MSRTLILILSPRELRVIVVKAHAEGLACCRAYSLDKARHLTDAGASCREREPHRCFMSADANGRDQRMATDLLLAIAHHLLIFVLFGILVSELVLTQQSMTGDDIKRLASIDLWYGIVALSILIVGFSRAIFAAKGWNYYSANYFFWAKIAVFVLIALLSIWPTMKYLNWRKDFRSAGSVPDAMSISGVRHILWLEVVLFPFLPAFAAATARGYGE